MTRRTSATSATWCASRNAGRISKRKTWLVIERNGETLRGRAGCAARG